MQKLRRAIKKYLKTVDKWLLVFCVFLSTLSVLLLYSLYQSDLAQTLRLTERTCIVQLAAMFLGLGAAVHFKYRLSFYCQALEAVHTDIGFSCGAYVFRGASG